MSNKEGKRTIFVPARSDAAGSGPARVQAAGPTGVLLLNLGTPRSPRIADVRRYLREFLLDPRVIDLPAPARWLLVHGAILPLRPRTSGAAYAKIWSERGSPLLEHSQAIASALAAQLGPGFRVELGMRYGEPAIAGALERLLARGADPLVVAPLFPQYAASSTGSALELTYRLAGRRWNVPPLRVLAPYYDEPGYIGALADSARPALEQFQPDHVLLSYHGLPERQIRRSDASGAHCFASPKCCESIGPANAQCYRAHCTATSRALVRALGLAEGRYGTSFQSRLGRTPWIVPHTDKVLPELAQRGVRRLAVMCPSFVADCLETLEEIGIRAREQWLSLGGEELLAVPCMNAHPSWIATLARWVRARADRPAAEEVA